MVRGGTVVTFSPPSALATDLLVRGGCIAAQGRGLAIPPDAEVIDARGKIIIPGLVDAFSDLVARPWAGLHPASVEPSERVAKNRGAHDETSVICSLFMGSVRALQCGVTTLFHLHNSPRFVDGCLARARDVLLTVGGRAVIAYRVTGEDRQAEIRATHEGVRLGGGEHLLVGVGAAHPSQLPVELLRELAAIRNEEDVPFLGELGGRAGADKLARAGLLGADSVLGCLQPTSEEEMQEVRAAGATPVILPRHWLAKGGLAPGHLAAGTAIGTGMFAPNLLSDLRLLGEGAEAIGHAEPAKAALALLARGHELASKWFGFKLGSFEPGSAADLVMFEHTLSFPLNPETVASHIVFGFDQARVRLVMVGGRPLVRDGRLATVDVEQLHLQMQRGALDFWTRLAGTPFPGLGAPEDSDISQAEDDPIDDHDDEDRLDNEEESANEDSADNGPAGNERSSQEKASASSSPASDAASFDSDDSDEDDEEGDDEEEEEEEESDEDSDEDEDEDQEEDDDDSEEEDEESDDLDDDDDGDDDSSDDDDDEDGDDGDEEEDDEDEEPEEPPQPPEVRKAAPPAERGRRGSGPGRSR